MRDYSYLGEHTSDYNRGYINGEKETRRQLRVAAQIAWERGYNYRIRLEWFKLFLLMLAAAFIADALFKISGI